MRRLKMTMAENIWKSTILNSINGEGTSSQRVEDKHPKVENKNPKVEDKDPKVEIKHPLVEDKNPKVQKAQCAFLGKN